MIERPDPREILVVYLCVTDRCGLQLMGLTPDEHGQPHVGVWSSNSNVEMPNPAGGMSWRILGPLERPRTENGVLERVKRLELPEPVKAEMRRMVVAAQKKLDDGWLVSCRRKGHGPWDLPNSALRRDWDTARRLGRQKIRLNDSSEFKSLETA